MFFSAGGPKNMANQKAKATGCAITGAGNTTLALNFLARRKGGDGTNVLDTWLYL